MFRIGPVNCSSSFAKPLYYSGFITKRLFLKGEFADGGRLNPTILLPRLSVSFSPASTSKRGTNPFHYSSPRHNQRLSKMASTKEFRLLCLENPLLGKYLDRRLIRPLFPLALPLPPELLAL